jgi:hypothetical protein
MVWILPLRHGAPLFGVRRPRPPRAASRSDAARPRPGAVGPRQRRPAATRIQRPSLSKLPVVGRDSARRRPRGGPRAPTHNAACRPDMRFLPWRRSERPRDATGETGQPIPESRAGEPGAVAGRFIARRWSGADAPGRSGSRARCTRMGGEYRALRYRMLSTDSVTAERRLPPRSPRAPRTTQEGERRTARQRRLPPEHQG